MAKCSGKTGYYKKKNNRGSILWARPRCDLNLRFVGDPIEVVRIFTKDKRCLIVSSEQTGYKLQEKYPEINVSLRYACWCFDRHDNTMKILDMPKSVASAISNREVVEGKKISDVDKGCDWKITTNGRRGLKVKYEVNDLEETPLSAIERNQIIRGSLK